MMVATDSADYHYYMLDSRFWSKVNIVSCRCWEWTAAKDLNGYGKFRHNGRLQMAHRLAYENEFGPVDEGMVLDHLCRNPGCVNPFHLDQVTQAENVRRGRAGQHNVVRAAAQTHCVNGHEYTAENTYRPPGTNHKQCRECRRIRAARDRKRKREQSV